jgi:glycosyltransferase involved in cell wall biosynthesis
MKGRRVVFVLGNLELGGAERQALILAKHLVQYEQADVEVWGFNHSGPVAGLCDQHHIASRVIPSPDLLKFARLLRQHRPDILLPYTSLPNVLCGLVWQRTGARLCVWNQRDEGIFSLDAKWLQRAARQTPRFISNSNAGARYLIEQLNVDPEKVRVIPNGIEAQLPQADRTAWRTRLEIDDAAFVACMVANVHANKDHATLLKAWRLVVKALKQRGRKAVLVLAGRHYGAYESLVDLTNELEIASNVRFAGYVSDVAGLLGAVDLGVFSSCSEGCPNGVLECMAAGLAVVGTDIEVIREVAGESEFLAPCGNAKRFAEQILKLAADPALCATIGAANQSRIKARYNARRMCEDTVSLLTT